MLTGTVTPWRSNSLASTSSGPSATQQPRQQLFAPVRTGLGAALAAVALLLPHAPAAFAQDAPLVSGCPPRSSCVSTSAINAPRSFMAPWVFEPLPQDRALRSLVDVLSTRGADVSRVDEQQGLVEASVTYGRLPNGAEDVDDVKFLLREGRMVLFRSESRVSLPDPPFCLKPGCINGPRNRQRMDQIRDDLGWGTTETDEDKLWQQLLLH